MVTHMQTHFCQISLGTQITIEVYIFMCNYCTQRMTKAEHKRPIPKFFGNRPSASAAEVFGETIGLVIYSKIFLALHLSPYS